MSTPLEHDYIGLSEVSSMEQSSVSNIFSPKKSTLKTELSLGLPGSESPERKPITIFGKDFDGKTQFGSSSSGAKRGFSDAIDDSEKWVFNVNGKNEGNLSKDGCLYSPRGVQDNNNSAKKLGLLKEVNVNSSSSKPVQKQSQGSVGNENRSTPATKAQVVGWPPIRSFRKNSLVTSKNNEQSEEKSGASCLYVKVSMDGAPYLRKVDLQTYGNYKELSSALEKMFNCFITGQNVSNGHGKRDGLGDGQSTDLQNAENVLTYEDKDGDWMLVGDVPWRMFTENCRKLRIMKGSEAIGLAPNAAEKCENEV